MSRTLSPFVVCVSLQVLNTIRDGYGGDPVDNTGPRMLERVFKKYQQSDLGKAYPVWVAPPEMLYPVWDGGTIENLKKTCKRLRHKEGKYDTEADRKLFVSTCTMLERSKWYNGPVETSYSIHHWSHTWLRDMDEVKSMSFAAMRAEAQRDAARGKAIRVAKPGQAVEDWKPRPTPRPTRAPTRYEWRRRRTPIDTVSQESKDLWGAAPSWKEPSSPAPPTEEDESSPATPAPPPYEDPSTDGPAEPSPPPLSDNTDVQSSTPPPPPPTLSLAEKIEAVKKAKMTRNHQIFMSRDSDGDGLLSHDELVA